MPSIDEPPIDLSLAHYMEQRALAIALEKAQTADERGAVGRLQGLRAQLMAHRDAFTALATARRHARGEIYTAARVAAINAMGRGRESMNGDVKALYLRAADTVGVLKAHARTHFAAPLVSQRLGLPLYPPDVQTEAREMHAREEAFAAAWVAAIGDPAFAAELQASRHEALVFLRTSARPMHFVTSPPGENLTDQEAAELGKLWNKLDSLAESPPGRRPMRCWRKSAPPPARRHGLAGTCSSKWISEPYLDGNRQVSSAGQPAPASRCASRTSTRHPRAPRSRCRSSLRSCPRPCRAARPLA